MTPGNGARRRGDSAATDGETLTLRKVVDVMPIGFDGTYKVVVVVPSC